MTPLTAAMATLLKRRVALAAAIVAVTGATAGIVVAAAHTATPAAASPQVAASSTPSPSPPAGARTRARHPLITALVVATAKETGLSITTIRSDLRSGQTLNQVAGSKAGDVENDVLTALRTRLDKAVAGGRLTKDQETARLNAARTRIGTLLAAPLGHRAAGAAQPAA